MNRARLSVPPRLRDFIHAQSKKSGRALDLTLLADPNLYVGTDPVRRKLGSGGGTVNLLVDAWRAAKAREGNPGVFEWIAAHKNLVLHAAGESRRLPAYAGIGKAFLPMPRVDGLGTQSTRQVLADFQIPNYQQTLREAGPKAAVLVASGDVWLDFNPLVIPSVTADIAGVGMRVSPELAQHFGVFFVRKDTARPSGEAQPISFFLQKPSPEVIDHHLARYDFYVDTGMWLLSLDAVKLLFRRCGWDESRAAFATEDGHPTYLDLYTEIGSALGEETKVPASLKKLGWSQLRNHVIPLDEARFYHLGSSRQLFESFEQIQRGQFSSQNPSLPRPAPPPLRAPRRYPSGSTG